MPRIMAEYRDEVRKKIIEIAYRLFLSRGFHRTTMDDIAGALGVTKPALYQYFPGKEDLFAAVAERGRQELKGILERSYEGRDLRDGSAILFDEIVRFAPHFRGMYAEMMLMSAHSDRMRRILEEDLRGDLGVIERFIALQQENGLVSRKADTHTLAVVSHAVINGLLLAISSGMDPQEAKNVWIATVDAITRIDTTEP